MTSPTYPKKQFAFTVITVLSFAVAGHWLSNSRQPDTLNVNTPQIANYQPINTSAANFSMEVILKKGDQQNTQQYTTSYVEYKFNCKNNKVSIEENIYMTSEKSPIGDINVANELDTSASCNLLTVKNPTESRVPSLYHYALGNAPLTVHIVRKPGKTYDESFGTIFTSELEQLLKNNLPAFDKSRNNAALTTWQTFNSQQQQLATWANTQKLTFNRTQL